MTLEQILWAFWVLSGVVVCLGAMMGLVITTGVSLVVMLVLAGLLITWRAD